jgi:F-type H+-transporting ATPase subunit epsilon
MADTFKFEIVDPTKSVLSEDAELVIIPGGDGDFGVLPGHAPMLSTLRPGVVEIRERDLKIQLRIFVAGGFAEVTPERCTVLAETAVPVAEIDRDAAEGLLKEAHDSLEAAKTPAARSLAEKDMAAAEALLNALEGV